MSFLSTNTVGTLDNFLDVNKNMIKTWN